MTIDDLYKKVGFVEDGERRLSTRKQRSTSLSFFIEHYGDKDLTYDRLMSIKLDGWEVVFNEWKQKGILD